MHEGERGNTNFQMQADRRILSANISLEVREVRKDLSENIGATTYRYTDQPRQEEPQQTFKEDPPCSNS